MKIDALKKGYALGCTGDEEGFRAALAAMEQAEQQEPTCAHGVSKIKCDFCKQAEQAQPVACPYCHNSHTLGAVYFDQNCAGCVKRMTAPPPQRQPLTNAQIKELQDANWKPADDGGKDWNTFEFARAIEAAHGIGKGDA